MDGNSAVPRKAQLDKEEREHLEDVVTEMRDRVEANVRYQLEEHDLEAEPDEDVSTSDEKGDLVEAIELEAVDGNDWAAGYEQYVTGVGYTIVNRLAALRCMEVRNFVDEEVTRFREDGLTPAADRLVTEEFMLEEEAVLEAYRNACDDLAAEIEILFDRSTAYSLVDPDDDTYEDLCALLDEVPDEVWRADDVLGWVYEYYNVKLLDDLRRKGDREGLEPEDVPAANQFYTPHWVVRMLTDNSLGKLYLEATGRESAVPDPSALGPEKRRERPVTPEDSPTVAELCTYLIPDAEAGDAPEFGHPSELRVIDPACGSGHFLLYAFDVLERIWWAETDLDRAAVPAKVLEHNLTGVDIDLRSCQLSAFNLYLKARTRTEEAGGQFEMPSVDIVCADARVAEVEAGAEVLDGITGEGTDLRDALGEIIDTFQHTEALGSLLDVSGVLEDAFESRQTELSDWGDGSHGSLNSFLQALREAVDERTSDSFGEQNLRSFLNLLVVLTREYDVALMNPPYGAGGRMPGDVTAYVDEHYEYGPEYYINFFEACDRLAKRNGRVGMIVQRSFMYKSSFRDFREDFVGTLGAFDFLAEYGNGVLDRATVRTAGTVVRTGRGVDEDAEGLFYRLHDLDAGEKQRGFLESAFGDGAGEGGVERQYRRRLGEFSRIPGSPLSYWVPLALRDLYDTDVHLDANKGGIDGESLGTVSVGLCTGDDGRFVKKFWETGGDGNWHPFAKGGEDAWMLPRVNLEVDYSVRELESQLGSRVQNTDDYFSEALTYTYMKESGRRFGYLHESSIFGHAGKVFIPDDDSWTTLGYLNSDVVTYLMLAQTPERHWEVGEVSKLPWHGALAGNARISELTKRMVGLVVSRRRHDFDSPHYTGPAILQCTDHDAELATHAGHPHRELLDELELYEPDPDGEPETIRELAVAGSEYRAEIDAGLEELAGEVEREIHSHLGVTDAQADRIDAEIALRTNEDPRERRRPDGESVESGDVDVAGMVEDLLLHCAVRAVSTDDDGVVPVSEVRGEDDLLTRVQAEFERIWGEQAGARMAEVDGILGDRPATGEAYPNLRAWIEDDLFDYHVNRMENTPIVWKLTTERLLADSTGEGFACFIDYHSLDSGLFDRLSNQYLEPRKAELREQRSATNRRRSDESLSASEQAEATEQYERCASGLDQIAVFEDVVQDLASVDEREFDESDRALVEDLAPKVAAFREETRERVDTLAELHERKDSEWFKDTFSEKFWETVDEWRDEWLDALAELEGACEAYAKPTDEPVEAHLADLFDYFNWRLKGSDHYSSSGILFMTYYFEREGSDLLDENGRPHDHLSEDERRLASLAMGLDDVSIVDEEYLEAVADDEDVDDIEDLPPLAEFKALAEEIDDRCQTIDKRVPSDWADRALSEITTAGYQPNHKHGVEINITPLADAEIVPKTVDDDVL